VDVVAARRKPLDQPQQTWNDTRRAGAIDAAWYDQRDLHEVAVATAR
jgi:hypothetical protein